MKRAISLATAIFLLCGVSGCGSDSHDAYIKEMIDILHDARDILKRITDVKSAEEQATKLKDAGERKSTLRRKAESLKEFLSAEEKHRLEGLYKDKLQKALDEVAKESDRVMKIPRVQKALEERGALVEWVYSR